MYNVVYTTILTPFLKLKCGFPKGFNNAQHCLLVLVVKCREVLDKQGFAGILLTDISKAFDCMNYELLTAKLHAYDFSLESLTFIQSYLSNRIERVKINSSFSEYSNAESGVPHGYAYDLEHDKVIKSLEKKY